MAEMVDSTTETESAGTFADAASAETSDAADLVCGPDSDQTPTLSVVMPTLDEEAGVRECMERIRAAVAELGVPTEIVVSDSSSDRTPEIAREMGAVVVEPDEPGYGYAYRYAFERVRGEYVAMGDADTTYDFEELPKLLALVRDGRADIAMGSRLDGTIKPDAMPSLHQHVGNPFLTWFLNAFYDAGVSDAHSGFRVFTRDALETLDLTTDGMEFASEMIMDAGAKGLRIEEVPITYHPREGEAKLESFRDGWRHVKFMLVNAPGYLFSVPGMILGALGILVMSVAYLGVELFDQPFGIHSLIAGSLLTILGYQVGSFGLLSAIASDPIRVPDDPITGWIQRHFTLERGVLLGGWLFVVGAATAAIMIWQWIGSGFTELPIVSTDIVAFTLIVLGIQTVFGSFFMSILGDST